MTTTSLHDEDIARLRIALARIARLVDRQVSGGGLTRTQLSVLSTIARQGPLGLGELADAEGLNPTMLSRIVGKLEAAGLLLRSPDPQDRRAVTVEVTADGAALQQSLRRERTALFADRLAGVADGHQALLLAALPALEDLALQMRRPEPLLSAR
jgi:DNA-binding MarR family transcriptional regulator